MLAFVGLFILPVCLGIDSFVCNPNCVVAIANGTDHCNATTGECLYGCLPGQAGPNCSFVCPSNCELHAGNETETCNATTGECLYGCQPGYAGANCSVECPQTCASSNIRGTEFCNAKTEKCLFGCQNGYYGVRCENKCDDIVRYCKRCSLRSDNSVICDECILGFYRNSGQCSACNYWCVNNASTPVPFCRENDGFCIYGCKAGWYGFNCGLRCPSACKDICSRDLGHCLGCKPTSYCGPTCELVCSDGCVSSDCEQSCSCRLGCTHKKWGYMCDKHCSVNCNEPPDLNSNICERSNGMCSYKCKNDTFWGSQCDQKCSSKCSSEICEQATGNCTRGCNSKRVYGIGCDKACNNNCINGTCERYDGYCNSGCVAGSYGDQCHLNCNGNCLNLKCHRTTAYCEDRCVTGNYGEQCEKECSLTCLKRSCDRNTGTCDIGCVAGWHGDQCNKSCSDNCLNFICKREDGACTYGYLDGEGGSVSNSQLVAGLVSGWLVLLVFFVIFCVIAIKRYHLYRVCGDKKKLTDVQSEIAAHEDRVQHEYMTLRHEPIFTNPVASYDALETTEGNEEVQGNTTVYETVEAPKVNG